MASNFVTGLKNSRLDKMMRSAAGNVTGHIEFPSKPILTAMDKKFERILKRTGGFGRQRMRVLIGKRPPKAPAKFTKKGKVRKGYRTYQRKVNRRRPPFKRKGLLHRFTLFAYDLGRLDVVVGPALLPSKKVQPRSGVSTIPQLLDKGGPATMHFKHSSGRAIRPKKVRYRAFPYVNNAMRQTNKMLPKFVEQTPFK